MRKVSRAEDNYTTLNFASAVMDTEAEQALQSEAAENDQDFMGTGESLKTVLRHDKGHDDWHRSMGQEPCTSEEDCADKTEEHKRMEHKSL